jgi:signal transduction histidine kinase
MEHLQHLFHFDGILHWCFLIAVFGLLIGLAWVIVRVLLPLRQIARLAANVNEYSLPDFSHPTHGIAEIEQLRRTLVQMTTQIQAGQAREAAFRNALTDSQERERIRIAHEIHDDTIQSLIVVTHHMERALAATDPQASVRSYLQAARSQVVSTIDNLRQMIANLRPTVLDELGLITAIETLADTRPSLRFQVVGDAFPMDPQQELAIFRTVQEAITNAERHAQAKRISATLSYTDGGVQLEVSDDGVGFPVPRHLQDFVSIRRYGLVGIRERIAQLGGQLKLTSEVGHGTQISVVLPTVPQNALAK